MEPFERQFGKGRNINVQAIIAFVVAVLVAYFIQRTLDFRGGNLFTMLIVVAVGGGWYHLRKIV
jgi:hypothetical protein